MPVQKESLRNRMEPTVNHGISAYSPSSVSSISSDNSTHADYENAPCDSTKDFHPRNSNQDLTGLVNDSASRAHNERMQSMEDLLFAIKNSSSSSKLESEFNLIRPNGDTDTFSEFIEDEVKSVTCLPSKISLESKISSCTSGLGESEREESRDEMELSFIQKMASRLVKLVTSRSIDAANSSSTNVLEDSNLHDSSHDSKTNGIVRGQTFDNLAKDISKVIIESTMEKHYQKDTFTKGEDEHEDTSDKAKTASVSGVNSVDGEKKESTGLVRITKTKVSNEVKQVKKQQVQASGMLDRVLNLKSRLEAEKKNLIIIKEESEKRKQIHDKQLDE